MLLQGNEVNAGADTYDSPTPERDPHGIEGAEVLMTENAQSRALGITVVVLPDTVTAQRGLANAEASLSAVVPVPTGPPIPVPVGAGGEVVNGMSRDGLKAVAALVFVQDRTIVRMDFYTRPDVPTPIDYVVDVGQRQAIAVRVGLSRL